MKRYRCKHTVEAMRWGDTDSNREAFAAWFESHGAMFMTRERTVVLSDAYGTFSALEGEWVVLDDGEWVAISNERFAATYEEAP